MYDEKADLEYPDDADLILISHGHEEARKSVVPLLNKSQKDECKILCSGEVAVFLSKTELMSMYNIKKMNKGGSADFGWCKINMVHSDHSSSCDASVI